MKLFGFKKLEIILFTSSVIYVYISYKCKACVYDVKILNMECLKDRLVILNLSVLLPSSFHPPFVLLPSSYRPPTILLTSSFRPHSLLLPSSSSPSSSCPPYVLLPSSFRTPSVLFPSSYRPPTVLLPSILLTSSFRPPLRPLSVLVPSIIHIIYYNSF